MREADIETLKKVASAMSDVQTRGAPLNDNELTPITDYRFILHGKSLTIEGSAFGHEDLADGVVGTSALLYISADGKLARTMSRWYVLGAPASERSSSIGDAENLEDVYPSQSNKPLQISMELACKILTQRPLELAGVAMKHGELELALDFEGIAGTWSVAPPESEDNLPEVS